MKKINQRNERKLKFYYLFAIMLVVFSQSVFSQDPLKGETKIEDAKSNAENILMGNISAGRAADKVAYEISNYDPFIKSIVIYNQEQAELFAGYDRSMTQLQELKLKYGILLNRQKNFIDNFSRKEKCTTGGRKIASVTIRQQRIF